MNNEGLQPEDVQKDRDNEEIVGTENNDESVELFNLEMEKMRAFEDVLTNAALPIREIVEKVAEAYETYSDDVYDLEQQRDELIRDYLDIEIPEFSGHPTSWAHQALEFKRNTLANYVRGAYASMDKDGKSITVSDRGDSKFLVSDMRLERDPNYARPSNSSTYSPRGDSWGTDNDGHKWRRFVDRDLLSKWNESKINDIDLFLNEVKEYFRVSNITHSNLKDRTWVHEENREAAEKLQIKIDKNIDEVERLFCSAEDFAFDEPRLNAFKILLEDDKTLTNLANELIAKDEN